MKIRIQSIVLLLAGGISFSLFSTFYIHHYNQTNRATRDLQSQRNALIALNDFQVAANNQVLYGVDLIRTGDISGERIIPYRMAETHFSREIERLDTLLLNGEAIDKILELKRKGEKLAALCKEDMMDPLYSHKPLKEGIIEQLIYRELDGIVTASNSIRSELNDRIRVKLQIQTKQSQKLVTIYLPVFILILLFLFAVFFTIIHRSITSINRTKSFLRNLASGQCRLDVVLPVQGRDEISELCRSFNDFMGNLNSRHQALKSIGTEQVLAGEQLKRISLEHASALTQINQSLDAVDRHSGEISDQVESSAGEINRIARSLNVLEEMSREQERRVSGMAEQGREFHNSMALQQSAVERQIVLTEKVKQEGMNNKKILELLKVQIEEILCQSADISGAILAIQDLADQTDILAINASIEAAHAGAYGKGFAVVSGEMRSLADQIRQNTAAVSDLLTDLNGRLQLMADEEKQNRDSVNRLINQNQDAEEVISLLDGSMGKIRSIIGDFFGILEEVRTGSGKVHNETESVRASGKQITLHMEELRSKQRELSTEWREMSLGMSQLARGTGTLNNLSEENSRLSSTLNREIRMLGS